MSDRSSDPLLLAMLACGDITKHAFAAAVRYNITSNVHARRASHAHPNQTVDFPSPSTAVDDVFLIPELREMVLAYLEASDLHHLRGVSKNFRAMIKTTIEASPMVRSVLFRNPFAPRNSTPSPYVSPIIRSWIDGADDDTVSIAVGELSRTSGIKCYSRTLRKSYGLPRELLGRPSPIYASVYQRCYCKTVARGGLRIRVFDRGLTFGDIFKVIDAFEPCSSCCGVQYWLAKANYHSKRAGEMRRRRNGLQRRSMNQDSALITTKTNKDQR